MVQPNNGISQGESLCREEKGQKGSLTTKELGKGKGILGETFKSFAKRPKEGRGARGANHGQPPFRASTTAGPFGVSESTHRPPVP